MRAHRGELYEVFALNCGVCICTKAELLGVSERIVVGMEWRT